MLAVGIDLIEIGRVERALRRYGERFLRRVYTERELAYAKGRAAALATRWAAKEAVAKAFGTGIGAVRFNEIEILCDECGKPELQLHGQAAQLAAQRRWEHFAVSLSHAGNYAVACVVIQG